MVPASTRCGLRPDRSNLEEVSMTISTACLRAVPDEALAGGTPTAPVILALDLGQRTGWAVRNRDGAIASGVHEFRPGRFEGGGMIWLRFRAWLQEIDETSGGVGVVVFEEVRRASRHRCRPLLRRLPRAPHRLGRGEQDPVPGRAGRHDQAAHRRQGQRRQGGGDRRRPQARLRTGRRQRGRRAGAARLGDRAGDRRCAMNANADRSASRKAQRLGCRPRSAGDEHAPSWWLLGHGR